VEHRRTQALLAQPHDETTRRLIGAVAGMVGADAISRRP